MSDAFDAVVIGGGPAGASAALLLAQAGWSVALVERKAFPRRKVCGEYLSATNLPLLDRLRLGERFRALAGPVVKKVGLFAGRTIAQADLPLAPGRSEWGRALAREHLDTWLLAEARAQGADVLQPWAVADLFVRAGAYQCAVRSTETGAVRTLRTPIVIAAHGSWEIGPLPTQLARQAVRPGDLLAFKAHLRGCDLPDGLMPLLAFPGGYGGMVHCGGGCVSLSCCVRRDQLAFIRKCSPGNAGDAVLSHIRASCLGARRVLASVRREGDWLAAGPIRPGIRIDSHGGIFRVGNAAGEAHPAVAEGISMALQSSWLLAEQLTAWKRAGGNRAALPAVQKCYAQAWRKNFAPRIWASTAIAHWAMSSRAVSISLPLVWCMPRLLTWGARLSGKAAVIH